MRCSSVQVLNPNVTVIQQDPPTPSGTVTNAQNEGGGVQVLDTANSSSTTLFFRTLSNLAGIQFTLQLDNTITADLLSAVAAPTTGTHTVGEKVFNSSPTLGGPQKWECVTAGVPGVWKVSGQVGIASGATADRPTKVTMGVTNDVDWQGTMYLDTTLAANGKLVIWNGVIWVDSTGIAV